jgi:hypothetical protein
MSVDPNAFVCHFCGAQEPNGQKVFGHWVRENNLSTYETPRELAWWNLQGHRGLTGFACPSCMTYIDAATEDQINALLVAKRLTPE